jgi:hypothetical protein
MWKKIKVAVGALGLLGLAGVAGAAFLYGSGGFVVVAPAGVSVKTTLDGKELGTVAPGTHQRFPIAQGAHTVTLAGSGGKSKSYQLVVENGMFDKTLPVGAQCFAVFDVTNYWYEKKKFLDKLAGKVGQGIVVKSKYMDAAPFDTPSNVHYSTDDLPRTIKQGARTNLFLEVPCRLPKGTDEELVAAANL